MMRAFPLALLLTTRLTAATEVVAHVRLDAHKKDSFETNFWDLVEPRSPRFQRHLSLADCRDALGASATDLDAVAAWLLASGATTASPSALGDAVVAHFDEAAPPPLDDARRPAAVEFVVTRRPRDPTASAPSAPSGSRSAKISSAGTKGVSAGYSEYTVDEIKGAYGVSRRLVAQNATTTQMVWGPGTFGYSSYELEAFAEEQVCVCAARRRRRRRRR